METKVFIKNKINFGEKEEADKYCEFVAIRESEKGIYEAIRVRINVDGTLNINSNHQMKILPIASNSVFIDFSR